jgi:hypothetical protein
MRLSINRGEKIFTFNDHPKLCKINVLDGRLSFYKWLHKARVEFDREELGSRDGKDFKLCN